MMATGYTYDRYFDRDLSWLSFNARVLMEAAKPEVPVMERIKFLSIYSSNLDEFYRVRMPVLMALHKIDKASALDGSNGLLVKQVNQIIADQLQLFGATLNKLLPLLSESGVDLVFNQQWPQTANEEVINYFYSQVLSFLQPVDLFTKGFFPENNKLYLLVNLKGRDESQRIVALNIPSDHLSRFFLINSGERQIVMFLDDIIRYNLSKIFVDDDVLGCYSFKITRDAELDLKDEYPGELSDQIENQLQKRDYGYATRFLHQPGIPLRTLELITQRLNLEHAGTIEGGLYHNLKDLASLPVRKPELSYDSWPPVASKRVNLQQSIFDQIAVRDIIIHPPYQSYNPVLRFFNEAAVNPHVEEIYTTLYRVASDSRIVNALISAALNGKKVQVLIELKARFDEGNNLQWAKKLKKAGADILYSVTALKVHAKVALVKFKQHNRIHYRGLLATGNLNESTAKVYTDHILMTAHHEMLRELELLFIFLAKRKKPGADDAIPFNHLLVAQFNLQQRFLALIDREIGLAKQGKPAAMTIKLNNLEEQKLISKLYEASRAGVKVCLLVRSICCLIPEEQGMSEHITIKRIVDRYLEHGRIFIFNNDGAPEVYMGSADWMNRNIYNRIEVCFQVYDPDIKQELIDIVNLQLKDNVQAVTLNRQIENIPVKGSKQAVQSQREIYQLLKKQSEEKYETHETPD